ncbi:hypothetical protein C8F04DRAFT_1096408 [Mycena alexandri]|uniref:Transmembrane protein n=1 Tax=Mycena alexandri TaxID=1745969 RepID=A0AAD6SZ74_9AGAR|nr:hypothetical protein C8F04DRAFT_1096408 [Mycena alexandri]
MSCEDGPRLRKASLAVRIDPCQHLPFFLPAGGFMLYTGCVAFLTLSMTLVRRDSWAVGAVAFPPSFLFFHLFNPPWLSVLLCVWISGNSSGAFAPTCESSWIFFFWGKKFLSKWCLYFDHANAASNLKGGRRESTM